MNTTTSPARQRIDFLPDAWDGATARTTRCKLKAPYRVPARHRATYDRLAALTGLHGSAARSALLAELNHELPEIPPAAFSVVGPDEWILFADEAMTSEVVVSYAEATALVSPPAAPAPAARPKRTTKGELVSLLNRLLIEASIPCPNLAAEATALLENA